MLQLQQAQRKMRGGLSFDREPETAAPSPFVTPHFENILRITETNTLGCASD